MRRSSPSRFPWLASGVLLTLCGAAGLIFLCPREGLPVSARPLGEYNVLRIVSTQPLDPDPHHRTFPVSTYNHLALSLWEPLTECDPATGEPKPAAAESWSWSADRRVLTVKLRPAARWSNGDPVTAEDFVRGWLRLLRQGIEVAYALFPLRNAEAYHRGERMDPSLVGVRAIDAHTLRIELAQPRGSLLAELADPLLAPQHASNESAFTSKSYLRSPAELITNGPFRFAGVADDVFKLTGSTHYHASREVRLGGVHFIRVDNPTTGTLLVSAGEADLLAPMGRLPSRAWPTRRALRIDSELALAVVSIYFNTTRGPLQDVRVRRALALALNRAEIIGELDRERLVPAASWVPDMPGRDGLKLFPEDAAEARRLLAEAGYPGGKDFPVLRMSLPANFLGNPHPVACADQWFRELGVRVYVAHDSAEARTARLDAGDFDITYGALIATVPDAGDLLSTFLLPEIYSETKWRDAETTELLATANQKIGAERLSWLERAERRAMSEVPVVPLMFERRQVLRAAEVRGWYPDPLARQSLKHVSLPPPRSFTLSASHELRR